VMLQSWAAFVDADYPEALALSLAQDFLERAEKASVNMRSLGEQAVEVSAALAALAGLAENFPLSTEDLRAAAAACGVLGTSATFAASDVVRGSIGLRDAVQSLELAALLKAPNHTDQALREALKHFMGPVERAAAAAVDTVQAARSAEPVAMSFVQDLGHVRRQSAASASPKEKETMAGAEPGEECSQEAQDVESEKEEEEDNGGEEEGSWNCGSAPDPVPFVSPAPSGRGSSRKAAAHGRRLANHKLLQQLEADICQIQRKARGIAIDTSRIARHFSSMRQVLLETLCDGARLFSSLLSRPGTLSVEEAFTSSLGFVEVKAWGGNTALPRNPAAQMLRVAASLDPTGLARLLRDEVWPQILQVARGDPNIRRRCDLVVEALRKCEILFQY